MRFWLGVFEVVAFRQAGKLKQRDNPSFFLPRFLHGILSWISHVVQLLFPFLTLASLVLVYVDDSSGEPLYCVLHQGNCEFE